LLNELTFKQEAKFKSRGNP